MKKTIIAIISIILMIPLAMAIGLENFEAFAENSKLTMCEGVPTVQTITITNTGQTLSLYELTIDGSAAEFTSIGPTTLTLEPGESATSSLVISAKFNSAGKYKLKTYIQTTTKVTKIIEQEITITECANANLIANETENTGCPYSPIEYHFELENILPYSDSFKVGVDQLEDWVTTTMSTGALGPGQKVPFTITLTTPKDQYGEFEFSLLIQGKKSNMLLEMPLKAHVNQCYNFTMEPESVLLCEAQENVIPVTIKNLANIENDYSLELEGPKWATLSTDKVVNITGPGEGIFNIILTPEEHITGNFTLDIEAGTKIGDMVEKITLPIIVNECYELGIEVPNEKETYCAGETVLHPVNVFNQGMFTEDITVKTTGLVAAEQTVSLDAYTNKTVNVTVTVPEDVSRGYLDEVVYLPGIDNEGKWTRTKIKVVPKTTCYDTDIESEKVVKMSMNETSRTIPLIVKNNGLRTVNYSLLLETDAEWITMKQTSIVIEPGQSEIVYLEAKPVIEGEFVATLYAVTEHDLAFTKDVTIIVGTEAESESKVLAFLKEYMYYIIAGVIILAILITILKIFGK